VAAGDGGAGRDERLQGTLTQMGWFFTKAALLTFGGAYAVLPYVYQGAVETHQWLSGPQMIDGLALGETTPGPLIMVVAFVGFVGGWLKQVLGPDALFLGGALAATVVTFFTFLPSFVFILAGGPVVEATHGKLGFTAPLSAITAAVVGVILNLAMFFAYHVLWPQGFGGRFDAVSAAIAVAAAVALFRFKVGVMPLLRGAGLIATWLVPLALKELPWTHAWTAVRPRRAEPPVAGADHQPPPEQLRRRGQAAQCDPRPAVVDGVRHGTRFPAQRPQARGTDRHQLDAAARAVLRQPGRRRRDDGARR
jgi:chromate transport protein ChrA